MSHRRAAYRVRQFAWALGTRMRPQEQGEVEGFLSPQEQALFYGMGRPAQRHGLQVLRHLRRQGCQDRQLLAAALLHDVGKGRVTLAHRVAAVLLEALWPGLLARVASPQGGWRQGFYHHRCHAELGAELVRRAGSHPRVVTFIRYHHGDSLEGPMELAGLEALRLADEGS